MKKINGAWQVRRTFAVLDYLSKINQLPDTISIEWSRRGDKVKIIYDIRTTNYESVMQHLVAAGVVIKQSFWSRLVGKINQYSDKIGRENAATRPGPCCNKPPK
ncbi:MAG: hypothetical protein HOM84_07620 [Thiotrichales bacterium]|jgi:hypothetical protein|nr:hypothetical protein [Thiotrichales bacterium]MBT3613062.1 hypothetical protein [Thiotrichales bacterium]MBT3751964.1 hypothetical protein [Thiotrichales bacterium]MBT3837668.1 hypothetical protein [Thiotrichales bacterium]MBT4152294.1 hypothetical protein [Thiotrichales bacterium]